MVVLKYTLLFLEEHVDQQRHKIEVSFFGVFFPSINKNIIGLTKQGTENEWADLCIF